MEAAVEYLEGCLAGEVEYGRAAAAANCSTFHFLRMFAVVAGVTAGEYVRRRRLSRAALELSRDGAAVIDLALRFGYDAPDSFARAFKREFGVTPSEARKGGVRLRVWPRISFSIVLKGDAPMEMRIEKRGEIAVTGLARRFSCVDGANFREIPRFWDECHAKGHVGALARAIPPDSKLGVVGVCVNDFDEKKQTFTYLVGIERPTEEAARKALPRGCTDVAIPAGTWAVFASRGALPEAIQGVTKRIFAEWFPTSGYDRADGPDFEVYPEGDTRSSDYYCEVWIPVRKPAG